MGDIDELVIPNSVPTDRQTENHQSPFNIVGKIQVNDLNDLEPEPSSAHDVTIGTRYQIIDSKLNLDNVDEKSASEFTVSVKKSPTTNETKATEFAPIEPVFGFTTNRDNLLTITTLSDVNAISLPKSSSSSYDRSKMFVEDLPAIELKPSLVSQQLPDIFMERKTTEMNRITSPVQTEVTPVIIAGMEQRLDEHATNVITEMPELIRGARPSLVDQQTPFVTTAAPQMHTAHDDGISMASTIEPNADVTRSSVQTNTISSGRVKPSLIDQQMPFVTARTEMTKLTTEYIRSSLMPSPEPLPDKLMAVRDDTTESVKLTTTNIDLTATIMPNITATVSTKEIESITDNMIITAVTPETQVITESQRKVKPSLVLQQLPDINGVTLGSTYTRTTQKDDTAEIVVSNNVNPTEVNTLMTTPPTKIITISKEINSTIMPTSSMTDVAFSKIISEGNGSFIFAENNETPLPAIIFPKTDTDSTSAGIGTNGKTDAPILPIVFDNPIVTTLMPIMSLAILTTSAKDIMPNVPPDAINDAVTTDTPTKTSVSPVETLAITTIDPSNSISSDVKPTKMSSLPEVHGHDPNTITDLPNEIAVAVVSNSEAAIPVTITNKAVTMASETDLHSTQVMIDESSTISTKPQELVTLTTVLPQTESTLLTTISNIISQTIISVESTTTTVTPIEAITTIPQTEMNNNPSTLSTATTELTINSTIMPVVDPKTTMSPIESPSTMNSNPSINTPLNTTVSDTVQQSMTTVQYPTTITSIDTKTTMPSTEMPSLTNNNPAPTESPSMVNSNPSTHTPLVTTVSDRVKLTMTTAQYPTMSSTEMPSMTNNNPSTIIIASAEATISTITPSPNTTEAETEQPVMMTQSPSTTTMATAETTTLATPTSITPAFTNPTTLTQPQEQLSATAVTSTASPTTTTQTTVPTISPAPSTMPSQIVITNSISQSSMSRSTKFSTEPPLTTTMTSASNNTDRPMHLESQSEPTKGSATSVVHTTSISLLIINILFLKLYY